MALAFLGFANLSTAQVDATLNPLRLIFGGVGVAADVVLSDNFSVELGLAYGSRTISFFDVDSYKYTNLPITLMGKYYFNPDDGGDGFYAGAFARFVNRTYEDIDDVETFDYGYKVTRIGLGITTGFKIVSNSGIVFDIGFGAGRALVDNRTLNDETQQDTITFDDWSKLMLITKLSLGYRFGG